MRAGIGRTFQKPSVFDELTVLENVDLAASFRLPFRSLLRRRKGTSDAVAEALESVNLTEHARRTRPARSRTARSSGSRSRWCSSSARGCCCSTSRSPA